jgi:hypothetical protein
LVFLGVVATEEKLKAIGHYSANVRLSTTSIAAIESIQWSGFEYDMFSHSSSFPQMDDL